MTDGKDFNRKSDPHVTPHSSSRRCILTALAAGTGAAVLLPEKWVKPVVDKVMTPAHAQATVACSAPAGCYNYTGPFLQPLDAGSFTWSGGQGPTLITLLGDVNCPAGIDGEQFLMVVASSDAEATSLLGALFPILLATSPPPPQSCFFYVGVEGAPSDRRLKENVERVGYDPRTKLALYEFNYIGQPDARYRGVMADEVEPLFPEAVITRPDGMKAVKYGVLGIPFEKVRSLH